MPELNFEQKKAVAHFDTPLLIVAGAGTGKTTVIAEKIVHAIEVEKIPASRILALTFTDNAAAEMETRVHERLGKAALDATIGTFHSFCDQLLGTYGLDIGIPDVYTTLDETSAWLLVKKNLHTFRLDYYRPLGNPTRHIAALLSHFSKCKDELITPDQYREYAQSVALDHDMEEDRSRLLEVADAYHTYNQLLLDTRSLDFGDLIAQTVRLLEERPLIRKKLAESFDLILVDEFQDVNWAQYTLVRLLTNAGKAQLTVVGDDDQSIYAFRGASVSNILRFTTDFPNAQSIVLTENYRSGQDILDASYRLIEHNNPDRLETKLHINKKLVQKNTEVSSGAIEVLHFSTGEEEAENVFLRIQKMRESDPTLSWDDIAILVRANSHANPFIKVAGELGIPAEFWASQGLYYENAVVDAINVARGILNYHDSFALYRMLIMPCVGLSEQDIQEIGLFASQKKAKSTWEALQSLSEMELSPDGRKRAEAFVATISRGVREKEKLHPKEILFHALSSLGYFDFLTKKVEAGDPEWIRQSHHLNQFLADIEKYESTHHDATLFSFMDYFESVVESGDDGAFTRDGDTPDSVNILTIHRAKGLEFRVVFVVNCVEQRFPPYGKSDPIPLPLELIHEELPEGDSHYAEERRLCYVAATRAKEHLFFTLARSYGGARETKPSRFLTELAIEEKKGETQGSVSAVKKMSKPKKEAVTSTLYKLPKTFSFSQLKVFEESPYIYKLRYLLHIPDRGSAAMSFGTTMHSTLQRFYERVVELNAQTQTSLFAAPLPTKSSPDLVVPSLDELLALYEEKWVGDWYDSESQRESYFKKGKEMIRAFYADHQGPWTAPVALEKGFTIPIGEYRLSGKIDRIDRDTEGKTHIVDYKTGKPKEKLTLGDKEQLLLYQIAAETTQELSAWGEVASLSYYYLDSNTRVSFLGTSDEKLKVKNKCQKLIEEIYATDWSTITSKDQGYFGGKIV